MIPHAKGPAECAMQDSQTASGTAGGRFLLDGIHMNNKTKKAMAYSNTANT